MHRLRQPPWTVDEKQIELVLERLRSAEEDLRTVPTPANAVSEGPAEVVECNEDSGEVYDPSAGAAGSSAGGRGAVSTTPRQRARTPRAGWSNN